MIKKESDGKHFDPRMVGTALITKTVFAIFVTLWKIVMIGDCFGTVGRNGRTPNSPNFIL